MDPGNCMLQATSTRVTLVSWKGSAWCLLFLTEQYQMKNYNFVCIYHGFVMHVFAHTL